MGEIWVPGVDGSVGTVDFLYSSEWGAPIFQRETWRVELIASSVISDYLSMPNRK